MNKILDWLCDLFDRLGPSICNQLEMNELINKWVEEYEKANN